MTRARHDPAYLAEKIARAEYPHRPRVQAACVRGFLAACGDPRAETELTGCDAERAGADRVTPRDRELLALKLASPHRAPAGAIIVAQADAGHLPLFVAANEPQLF